MTTMSCGENKEKVGHKSKQGLSPRGIKRCQHILSQTASVFTP